MKRYSLFAAVAVMLAGCGDATSPTTRHAVESLDLILARQHWHAQNLHSYSYTLSYDCFCPNKGPLTVMVVRDTVYSAVDTAGVAVARGYAMTIDDLFDLIQTGLEHDVRVEASFDAQLWYPTSILYNPAGLANDTGGSYGARDLHPAVVLRGDPTALRRPLQRDADQRPR